MEKTYNNQREHHLKNTFQTVGTFNVANNYNTFNKLNTYNFTYNTLIREKYTKLK